MDFSCISSYLLKRDVMISMSSQFAFICVMAHCENGCCLIPVPQQGQRQQFGVGRGSKIQLMCSLKYVSMPCYTGTPGATIVVICMRSS